MDIADLERLGFQIQAEQERAVLPLSKEGRLSLQIDGEENLMLLANGAQIQVNTEGFNEENIINSLKELFKDNTLEPPF